MARKKNSRSSLPATPEALIEALLAELQPDEPDERRVDVLRAALLEMGDAYVPALMERIQECADEQDSTHLALTVHALGDPRLVEPLKAVAHDPDNSVPARITAAVALKAYGVNVRLDLEDLPPPEPEQMMAVLDEATDLLVSAQSSEGVESLAAGLMHMHPELGEALLIRLVARHGEDAAPVFAYLAQHPEADVALPAVKALAYLPHPLALRILQQVVEESPYPQVSQEARRALFRLCEMGVPAPSEDAEIPLLAAGERWTIERALLSNVDGIGSRLIFLGCILSDGDAVWVNVCLNDVVGIKDCMGKECLSGELEEDFRSLKKARLRDLVLVDADPNYCHWLIAEAREKNRQSHFPLPIGCHTWLTPLGAPPVRYDAPLIYELLDARKIKDAAALLMDSDSLLGERGMEGWIFRFDDVRLFAEQVTDEARGFGALSFGIVGVIPEDTLSDAVTTLFTDETRWLLARRLEEVAYVFWQRNKKKKARQCVVVAQALTSEEYAPLDIPFAVEMVTNSISAAVGALLGHYDATHINASPWDPVK